MCVVRRKVFQMSVALKILELWDVGNGDVCLSDFQFCLYLETLETKLKMTKRGRLSRSMFLSPGYHTILEMLLTSYPGAAPQMVFFLPL